MGVPSRVVLIEAYGACFGHGGNHRHCEERSDEAIQRARSAQNKKRGIRIELRPFIWRACRRAAGLLRCARNDAE
jgi:hypothetical protein